MCNLFKNTLNDTPFFRKLHVEERNGGRLNTGVCVLGVWSALSLQALSSPRRWCCLGVSSETALPPPTAPPLAGDFVPFLLLEDTPTCAVTITSGGSSWGLRAQGLSPPPPPPPVHHPKSWRLVTDINCTLPGDLQKPILLGWQPCHSVSQPTIFALKIPVFFCYPTAPEQFWDSAASGCQWVPFPPARSCKGRQPLSVPCEDVLFDKRWCDGQEWNCSPQSLWEKGLLGSSCISHHKSNGKQKKIHPKPSEGTN